MHGRSAFVAPRGVVDSSSAVRLTKDGKRVSLQPLEMFTGLEGEAFGFLKDVLTAGATGGTGDVIAQLCEKKANEEQAEEEGKIVFFEEPFELDLRRSLSYAGFAAGYTGAFQHFLFSSLHEAIPDPMVRVIVNQGLIIPLCYYSLLVWLVPKLRARSEEEVVELRESINVMKMIPRNWAFWVPLQFVQFNFIPMEFQVVYCSFLGLIWNIALSLLTAGGSKTEDEPLPETAMVQAEAMADVKISIPASTSNGMRTPKPAGLFSALQSANSASLAAKSESSSSDQTGNWLRILNGGTSDDSTTAPVQAENQEQEDFLETIFRRRS